MADFERFIRIEIRDQVSGAVYRNYDDGDSLANMGIASGTLALDEILCTGDFKFGECNANKFECQLFGINGDQASAMPDISGCSINVTNWAFNPSTGQMELTDFIFDGKIDSAIKDNNNDYRNIVAYDSMYYSKDIDIGPQWEKYWEEQDGEHKTHTLKEIREAVCGFVDMQIEPSEQEIETVIETIPDQQIQHGVLVDENTYNETARTQWVIADDVTGQVTISVGEDQGMPTITINRISNKSSEIFTILDKSSVLPGVEYTLSFDHKGNSTDVYVESYQSDSEDVYYGGFTDDVIVDVPRANDWTHYEATFTPGGVKTAIFIGFSTTSRYPMTAYRNVTVKATGRAVVPTVYPNDDVVFCYHDYQPGEMLAPNLSSITFGDMMSAICQIQGVCPNMSRRGKLQFLSPSAPEDNQQPVEYETGNTTFEDYSIAQITGFNVYANSDTPLFLYPEADNSNPYVISGNIFLVTVTEDQAQLLLSSLLPIIQSIQYTPGHISVIISNLNTTLCQYILTEAEGGGSITTRQHLIMSQTLSGPLLVNQGVDCTASGELLDATPDSANDSKIQNLQAKEYNTRLGEVETKVKAMVTKESVDILVEKVEAIEENGATKLNTSGKHYKFDDEGLSIESEGAETKTFIDEDGMEIRNSSDERVLTVDHEGVNAMNLTARQYLIIGTNSRFEDFERDGDTHRTACFFIGRS